MELCETGESDLVERLVAALEKMKMGRNIEMDDIIELMKKGPGWYFLLNTIYRIWKI